VVCFQVEAWLGATQYSRTAVTCPDGDTHHNTQAAKNWLVTIQSSRTAVTAMTGAPPKTQAWMVTI